MSITTADAGWQQFSRELTHRTLLPLTDRESAVLELMARGFSNREIAAALFLSPKTVETHVGTIFMKLDLDGSDGNRRVLAVVRWLLVDSLHAGQATSTRSPRIEASSATIPARS